MTSSMHLSRARFLRLALALALVCGLSFAGWRVGAAFVALDAAGGATGILTNSSVEIGSGRMANLPDTATPVQITVAAAPAQTFVVTKTADTDDGTCDADCSLREAINAANNAPAAGTITFDIPASDPGCNGGAGPCTILLTIGQMQLAQSVTINGPTPPALPVIIDGNHTNRVFLVSDGTSFINNRGTGRFFEKCIGCEMRLMSALQNKGLLPRHNRKPKAPRSPASPPQTI